MLWYPQTYNKRQTDRQKDNKNEKIKTETKIVSWLKAELLNGFPQFREE